MFYIMVGVYHLNCIYDKPWKPSRAPSALPLFVGEKGTFDTLSCCLFCVASFCCLGAYGLCANFMFENGSEDFAIASFVLTLPNGTFDLLSDCSSISFFTNLFRLSPTFLFSEFYSLTATGCTEKLQLWSRFWNFCLLSTTWVTERLPPFETIL